MIGLDTNILVYAHREGTSHHQEAYDLVRRFSESPTPYALFWPSLYEFLRIVTHHGAFDPPSTQAEALAAVEAFIAPPAVRVLAETAAHGRILHQVLSETNARGNLVHDAHLVALALEHGVHEILTFDEDFRRFRQITITNPFLQ